VIVIDASATLAWCFEDERNAKALRIAALVRDGGALVPGIWPLEVANILWQAERRKRITAEFRHATLADLSLLGVAIDPDTAANAWSTTLRMCERHGLTSYDAAYVELAVRSRLPLATYDSEMRLAAVAEGIDLVD